VDFGNWYHIKLIEIYLNKISQCRSLVEAVIYLTRDEYIAQRPEWLLESCWEALATEWSSPEFKQRSETNRANRYSQKFKPHKGGSNSIATIRQKLVSVHLLYLCLIQFSRCTQK
jgi:hypothetical protein